MAGGDRLRAGHADREQVVETLKDAFVNGRLTRYEFDARAGKALAARTRADLDALTADIPPERTGHPELAVAHAGATHRGVFDKTHIRPARSARRLVIEAAYQL